MWTQSGSHPHFMYENATPYTKLEKLLLLLIGGPGIGGVCCQQSIAFAHDDFFSVGTVLIF